MMICPDSYINELVNYTYVQLVEERNSLIKEILEYEDYLKGGNYIDDSINPSPYVRYKMNQEYLMQILLLMKDKIGMDEEDLNLIEAGTDEEKLNYISDVFYSEDEFTPEWMFNRAEKLLNEMVEQNSADAINFLGALYYEGKVYTQDQKKAIGLYKKAAELGCSLAMINLGYAYMHGNGADVNNEMAYKYFSMAEQRGELEALNKLGDMYKEGIYVTKDESMALYLYYKCLEKVPHDYNNDAYPGALRRIGECFLKGIGIGADIERAKAILTDAVNIYEIQINNGNYYAGQSITRAKELLEEAERLN